MFIKIGGIQGAGKTTITQLLLGKLRGLGIEADIVHGGDIMAQILGITVDELRFMPEYLKADAREKMFRFVYAEDRQNPHRVILRDAHFSFLDKVSGQFVIVPYRKEDYQQMRAMVVLDVPVEEIIRRRSLEIQKRTDRVLDPDMVLKEKNTEIITARIQARDLGIPLMIINNSSVLVQETCDHIVKWLRNESIIDPEIYLKKGVERIA